ncbi:hypothetical protein [Streptomyces sp. NPDC059757]|uniref:hypothetical protein n=1 Tax=Streptomyces sp. NPDC059757 TaxID=3346935 RepID=UPI0036556BA0
MTPRTARVAAYEQCAQHSLPTPLSALHCATSQQVGGTAASPRSTTPSGGNGSPPPPTSRMDAVPHQLGADYVGRHFERPHGAHES